MIFRISVSAYEQGERDDPENIATTAELTITLGDRVLTRHFDQRAKSVRAAIRVATYPVAYWLASAYWRLCYEPQHEAFPSVAWRLAHELNAAGDGYQWPRVCFVPDGEEMHIWGLASPPSGVRSASYLQNATGSVPLNDFLREIHGFVTEVSQRLEAMGLTNTAVAQTWSEVQRELQDPDLARYRKLEARLGYDPDGVEEETVEAFLSQSEIVGASALDELAPICATSHPVESLTALESWAAQQPLTGTVAFPNLQQSLHQYRTVPPWRRGQYLAGEVRRKLGLDGTAISNSDVANWVGLTEAQMFSTTTDKPPVRISLGVRQGDNGHVRYALTKFHPQARRFELARLLCDHATAEPTEAWVPATSSGTARQRMQRAFAAELLCPINELRELLGGDYSDDTVDEATQFFDVQERVVLTQLVNHGDLPRSVLGDVGDGFPYRVGLWL